MNLKCILIMLCMFCFSINANNNYNEYKWTSKHKVLTEYVNKYKDRILEYTPYKIKKSEKYIRFIEATLAKEGVPKELVVLAAIESGFDPNAKSQANAVGMWQFRADTARDLGLVVNNKIDERRNWKKSTIAAAKYMKWMADEYFDGDYESAILAYNAGVGRVTMLMQEFDTRDPWEIVSYNYLPKESREFLPKFIVFMHYFYYLKNNEIQ